MNKLMKALLAGTILATSIGSFPIQTAYATGGDIDISPNHYYYQNLNMDSGESVQEYSLAKKFYRVLEEMNESGDFKDGVISYDLTNIVSQEQLKSWVENGNLEIPKAFGSARDSFLLDHPELFYIDMYKIQLSAGYSGRTYKGYIDSGREHKIYRDNAFKNEQEVDKAIDKYNAEIKRIADKAKVEVLDSNPLYKQDAALAMAVNNEIAKNVKYDFGLMEDWNANGENAKSIASLGHTGYGALINKQAVCSGYSQAFKSVMDYLGVPCIIVSGYSTGMEKGGTDTEGVVPHAWNRVQLEVTPKGDGDSTSWFAFDTTWNSVKKNKSTYALMDFSTESSRHQADPVISSSGYSMKYPILSALDYASAVNTDMKDRNITKGDFHYNRVVRPFEEVFDVKEYISWKGMNAEELVGENTETLRIVQRYYYNYNGDKKWSQWQDLANSAKYDGLGISNEAGQTQAQVANNMLYTQYAVVKGMQPDVGIEILGMKDIYYSDDTAVINNAVYISDKFENPVYGTYTAAPFLNWEKTTPYYGLDFSVSDDMKNKDGDPIMKDSKAIHIKLVYDEPLHILDESKDIIPKFTSGSEGVEKYAGFVAFEDGKYVHLLEDENGVPNTLEFKFKPSLMYEHNRAGYHLSVDNVGSAKLVEKKNKDGQLVMTTSDKAPNPAFYVFSRWWMACPNVFGDGRLYVDCCAQPTLVDTSDFSMSDFKDENGNTLFSEQAQSQMMLVVNDVTTQQEEEILDGIEENPDISVGRDDILSSSTYDIDLQICGRHKKIPDGSYVKIALGFPKGYGPNDKGVTFKLFHRKHIKDNEYVIEEIPCVVTEFGIVATVESFSPYMVAVVNSDNVTDKAVVASVEGNGGHLGVNGNQVKTLSEGEEITYTITPDTNYQIYSVTMNGKDILDKVKDSKLTLRYDDLESDNEIEVKFVANGAVQRIQDKNIVTPVKVVVDGDNERVVSDVIEPSKDLEVRETWEKPTYEWSADGKSCVAKRISDFDNEEVENATVTYKLTKLPTCDTKGETTYTAKFDADWTTNQTKVIANIDATGHTFKWVIDKEATETSTGSKHEECTVCGFAKDAVDIPAVDDKKPSIKPDNVIDSSDNSDSGGNVSSVVETSDTSNIVLFAGVELVLTLVFIYAGYTAYKKKQYEEK